MTKTIEVSTHIEASVETVFSFFADPARFQRWFEHGSTIEPGPNGRVELRSPMGPPASGPIVHWEPNRRVDFRFGHPAGAGMLAPESTLVSVTLTEEAGGTRVSIRHTGIVDEALRHGAAGGWQASLGRLANASWATALGDRAPAIVASWTAAWRETDSERRYAHLANCFAERGAFRDGFARIDGRRALSEWIGGVQAMMPGVHAEPTGVVQAVQGHLSWTWRILGPGGAVMGTGHQYATLGPDLLIHTTVGFWNAPPQAG